MLSDFIEFIAGEKMFLPGDRVLLAVSGGMDSVAMAELFHRAGYSYGIAHCNFQLRGEESDTEEAFVRDLAWKYGVDLFVERFDTEEYAAKRKISIQMAARELRYEWFEKVSSEKGYGYVATAHHQDDQVETFLINLSRGTGLAGLHGILPKTGKIIRPILFAYREDIEDFIREGNIPYREDSSNRETYYLRNRLRHVIIPELEKAFPGFKQNILQTITNIRSAEAVYHSAIEERSSQLLKKNDQETRVDKTALKALHPLHTWIFEILKPYQFNAETCGQIAASLDNEPGRFFYSGTHRLLVDRDELIIVPRENSRKDSGDVLLYRDKGQIDHPVRLEWTILKEIPDTYPDDKNLAFLDYHTLRFPLEVRRWKEGDYFYPLGMKGRKKLSDFFIDMKLSRIEKEKTWLLCSGGEIAWVIGHRIDERFRVTEATKKVLFMRLA